MTKQTMNEEEIQALKTELESTKTELEGVKAEKDTLAADNEAKVASYTTLQQTLGERAVKRLKEKR